MRLKGVWQKAGLFETLTYWMGVIFSPLSYLWPWLLAAIIFVGFLFSDQGVSLSENFRDEPRPTFLIAVSIVGFFTVTVYGCLLASLAATTFRPRNIDPRSNKLLASRIGCIAGWICIAAFSPIVMFAFMTRGAAVVGVTLALSVVALAGVPFAILGAAKREQWWLKIETLTAKHRFVFAITAFVVACVPLGTGASITIAEPIALTHLGPLLLTLVGVGALCTVIGAIFVVLPFTLNSPLLGWAFAVLMVIAALRAPLTFDSENPLLTRERVAATVSEEFWEEQCKINPSPVSTIRQKVEEASELRKDGKAVPPIYLVSAEGGGIRAAYWTAMGLAQMDLATEQKFAIQLVSLSGVSGGSLGIATWLAAHDAAPNSPEERMALIAEFLGTDFLSPLLGGFFFLDAPRLVFGPLWPTARRDHVFERALFDRWKALSTSDFFARPLRRLCIKGFDSPPVVYFNATDALSGAPVALGNENSWQPGAFPALLANAWEDTSLRWITVGQAVSISARFPFLSPGAEVGVSPGQVGLTETRDALRALKDQAPDNAVDRAAHRAAMDAAQADLEKRAEWPAEPDDAMRIALLVDGGYFDNSALDQTIEAVELAAQRFAIRASEREGYKALPVHVLHFSNDPAQACLPLAEGWLDQLNPQAQIFVKRSKVFEVLKCRWQANFIDRSTSAKPLQFLTLPLETLFSVRTAHAETQVTRARRPFVAYLSGLERMRRPGAKEFHAFSLSQALTDMGNTMVQVGVPFGSSNWLLESKSIEEVYVKQRNYLDAEAANHPDISISKHFDRLDAWRARTLKAADRWACAQKLSARNPPLGWALSTKDRTLLDCLTARATVTESFPDPVAPYPPLGGSDLILTVEPPRDVYIE
ncbi:hypothetical protein ACA040_002237 [Xenophilus aerolatus]